MWKRKKRHTEDKRDTLKLNQNCIVRCDKKKLSIFSEYQEVASVIGLELELSNRVFSCGKHWNNQAIERGQISCHQFFFLDCMKRVFLATP